MAKLSFDLSALTANFTANGGTITRVESGVRAIESDREIYKAMREGTRAVSDATRAAQDEANRADDSYAQWERGVQNGYLRSAQGIRD